jgi:glutamate---cysteine ligase / carboxylate-amine ligase
VDDLPGAAGDLTIGLEEEVFLVDRETLDLAPRAPDVLARLGGDARFKLELPAAQLEILTPPCADVAAAADRIAAGRRALLERAGDTVGAIGSGVHPFAATEGTLNRGERYERIERTYRAIARRQLVAALQIHVFVAGRERALAVYNALRSYLPEIAALAANAPLQSGRDTGLASVRPTIGTMLPRQGVPPAIASWAELDADLRWGAAAGTVPDAGSWWWELRPNMTYGTLEVRVPDTQIDAADGAAVAAFVHCLVAWLAGRHDAGEALPVHAGWRIAENRSSACRDGVDGTLADLDSGAAEPTAARLERLIHELAPVAAQRRCGAELGHARRLCRRNGAIRQRAVAAERGPEGLVAWLVERFAA